MRNFDFTSWQGISSTILGLALFALIGVGIRVLMMLTIQQRQQRMNRQINERLRTLMSAYRTLGGSFTGELSVNPQHLRELRNTTADAEVVVAVLESDRPRRIRDAVEAALADILLLGTEEQVRLAAQAAREMAEGRPIHTAELVISLRNYIRKALDLEAVPTGIEIPLQGPTRPQGSSSRGGGKSADGEKSRGSGMGGGGMGGGGMGMGMGLGMGGAHRDGSAET